MYAFIQSLLLYVAFSAVAAADHPFHGVWSAGSAADMGFAVGPADSVTRVTDQVARSTRFPSKGSQPLRLLGNQWRCRTGPIFQACLGVRSGGLGLTAKTEF